MNKCNNTPSFFPDSDENLDIFSLRSKITIKHKKTNGYWFKDKIMDKNALKDHLFRTDSNDSQWYITRRDLLKVSASTLAGLSALPLSCTPENRSNAKLRTVRFGMVTDCHHADVEASGTRFYRQSLDKLDECVTLMNAEKVAFLIELGDFKDQDRPPVEEKTLSYLQSVEKVFQGFHGPTYHVLGNHDVDSLSKAQFLAEIENTDIHPKQSYYSFNLNKLHFVVLDANFKSDGAGYDHGNFDWTDANIPPEELAWLERDLSEASGPCLIFTHQLLDGSGSVYINNAADVRRILETSGKVLAVFQGHHHAGDYNHIAGIHYYTLKALVEGSGVGNNSYAIVDIVPNDNITITGYRKAESRQLTSDSVGSNV